MMIESDCYAVDMAIYGDEYALLVRPEKVQQLAWYEGEHLQEFNLSYNNGNINCHNVLSHVKDNQDEQAYSAIYHCVHTHSSKEYYLPAVDELLMVFENSDRVYLEIFVLILLNIIGQVLIVH